MQPVARGRVITHYNHWTRQSGRVRPFHVVFIARIRRGQAATDYVHNFNRVGRLKRCYMVSGPRT
jgi:hypothetical protein